MIGFGHFALNSFSNPGRSQPNSNPGQASPAYSQNSSISGTSYNSQSYSAPRTNTYNNRLTPSNQSTISNAPPWAMPTMPHPSQTPVQSGMRRPPGAPYQSANSYVGVGYDEGFKSKDESSERIPGLVRSSAFGISLALFRSFFSEKKFVQKT